VLPVVLLASLAAGAQSPKKDAAKPVAATGFSEITIARKPGAEDGTAKMTMNGKVRKIAPHAVAAGR
jgi:hypothetical protein